MNRDIYIALESDFASIVSIPPTAYEGVKFSKPDTEWCRITHLPATNLGLTIGNENMGGYNLHRGIMAIDIFAPTNNGRNKVLQIAELIQTKFKRGHTIVKNTTKISIENVSILTINQEDYWLMLPLRVDWFSCVST